MKLFFHLLDLKVLNSWILLSACGAKYTDRDFRLLLVRNQTEEAGKSQHHATPRLVVRPSVGPENVLLLEGHNKQWPAKCATVCVLVTTGCINAPEVMWACLRCIVLWNITPK